MYYPRFELLTVNLVYILDIFKINKTKNDRSCLVSKYNDCNSDYWCCVGSLLHIHL